MALSPAGMYEMLGDDTDIKLSNDDGQVILSWLLSRLLRLG